ncbi:hypothetical protein TanjilG_14954 [Lupinus angustifolius]|uniref:DUF3741 domain-containing protein n=1 Tax=Lupinus angustifolius TaxID=3871 RepID=A0A394DBC8_LUPAN|nr:hypothetical protein TanjilG_14954 [Lupinus angustifolius]
MGKEWHWAGKSFNKGAGVETQTEIPSGCMSDFFKFFDFYPFHFHTINNHQQQTTFNSAYCIPEDHTSIPKVSNDGITEKFQKNIQIKTSGDTRTTNGGNLNLSNSPGIKTPTLVARLMGLDLLPHSPSSLSSTSLSTPNPQGNVPSLHHLRPRQHIKTKPPNSTDSDIGATRSLPETPRISSSRISDVEYHRRLSLQINKENNMGLVEDSPSSPLITKYQDQNAQQPQLPRVLTKPRPTQQALLPNQQELEKQKWVPKC